MLFPRLGNPDGSFWGFDVVFGPLLFALLDSALPGKNGLWAATAIRAERLTAVVLSVEAGQRQPARNIARSGAFGYVVKPFTDRSLVPALELALRRFKAEQELRCQAMALREDIESQKAMERAKALLMEQHQLTEEQAMERMSKLAASSGKAVQDVAKAFVMAARAKR